MCKKISRFIFTYVVQHTLVDPDSQLLDDRIVLHIQIRHDARLGFIDREKDRPPLLNQGLVDELQDKRCRKLIVLGCSRPLLQDRSQKVELLASVIKINIQKLIQNETYVISVGLGSWTMIGLVGNFKVVDL